jgi:hypothetical protein
MTVPYTLIGKPTSEVAILTEKKFNYSLTQLIVSLRFVDSISKSHRAKGCCGVKINK